MESALKLSELLKNIVTIQENHDRAITGITQDSREVKEGNVFFALKGLHTDGAAYIPQVIDKGASAVVISEDSTITSNFTCPLITVPNLSARLGEIASTYYQHPSLNMTMIGVTGTNGKTSISQCIAEALTTNSLRCGVIGTLGYGFPSEMLATKLTTPDPFTLQSYLSDLYQKGAKAVAMEVSSHALEQSRTSGIPFKIAIFTNLTRDHLDYHGDMEKYGMAKKKLFQHASLKGAVINGDDTFGAQLVHEFAKKLPVYSYGLEQTNLPVPSIHAHQIHLNNKGITARVVTPWGEGQLRSRLLGRFNVSNLLAVLTTLLLLEIPLERGLELLSGLNTVPGRMQAFGGGKLPLVVVDYSHTPDSLMQALVSLREHTHGTLWCVFGCGGDRDQGKRPMMGQIAERYSDQLMITDDNPRTEDPVQIVDQIMKGLLCPWAVEIEHDRGAAIAHVISCAQSGDVVLVAGRGGEAYQTIGTEKVPFNDSDHVQAQLRLKQKFLNNVE